MGKTIKDLIISYMDKQDELWLDVDKSEVDI